MATGWPGSIPQTPQYGYQEQRQRNVIAFKPEVGPPKMRRASTAVGTNATATFIMTDDEVDTFLNFYMVDLNDGTLPFSWDHPVTGNTNFWMFSSDEAPTIERTAPNVNMVRCQIMQLNTFGSPDD